MADKWPLANGNWSTAANWNGGTLPVDGDVIYLDNRTITLDQNIDLPTADLRTTQRSGGTAGGNLSWSSGTYRIRLREILAGTSTVISLSGTAGVTWGTGTVIQGSSTTSIRTVNMSGSSPVVFESGCQAKNGVGGAQASAFIVGGSSTISGSLDAICSASVGTAPSLEVSGTPSITITGAIQHGFAATTISFGAAVGTWTITSETCAGTTTTNGIKISVGSAGLTLIRQSPTVFLFPTTWTTQHILMNGTSAQSFEYRGDIEQPTGSAIQWANSSANGTFRHRGTIYGSNPLNTSQMLTATAGGSKFVLDKLAPNSVSGRMPLLGAGWCMRTDSQIISPTESTNVTLVPSSSVGDPPAISNVRSGTVYHFSTLTGTCAVPGAGSVAAGVPVDATVGTAVLTQSQVQTGCNAALAAYDTNGVASADDLASVGVDLTPVLAKLPESGRASTQASVDSIAVALAGSAPVEPTGTTVFELLEDIQTDVGNVTGNIVIDSAGVTVLINALLAQGPTLYTALTTNETTLRIADEYVQEFTGLGDLTTRDNIAFALKTRKTDADTAALIYITETGGLTRVNGAVYATTANGSITVDDEAAGDITVRISSAVTAGLTAGKRQDAVKILIASGNDITKRQGITNVIDGTVAALG